MKRIISKILEHICEDTSSMSIEERMDRLEDLHQALFFLQIANCIVLIKLFIEMRFFMR